MSESWVELMDADVMPANSAERIGVAAAKGRDDLADLCAQTVEQVRMAYADAGRVLGPAGTVPAGLKARAIAIALWRFVSEGVAKNEGVQTRAREQAAEEARKWLDALGRGEVGGRGSGPSVAARRRDFGMEAEEGL
jgi:hypothetical protein